MYNSALVDYCNQMHHVIMHTNQLTPCNQGGIMNNSTIVKLLKDWLNFGKNVSCNEDLFAEAFAEIKGRRVNPEWDFNCPSRELFKAVQAASGFTLESSVMLVYDEVKFWLDKYEARLLIQVGAV